jgi:hypothetical protein
MRRKRKDAFAKKKVRRLARALVGPVPAAKVIRPKSERKKPKHKKLAEQREQGE